MFPKYVSGTHANCDNLADRQELLENMESALGSHHSGELKLESATLHDDPLHGFLIWLKLLAESEPLGRPNRWLNPVGAADFGIG